MRNFLRVIIIVFSILVLALAVVTVLVLNDMVSLRQVTSVIEQIKNMTTCKWIVCAVATVLGISSIVSILASDSLVNEMRGSIILPLTIGNVNISTQTFENIVLNVSKKYGSIKTTKVGIKIQETGVLVDIFVYVLQDTVISDITEKLQQDVKETVLKQTTVAVSNVNVKVKGIYALNEPKE